MLSFKDFRKWTEICAGIVRHYNCGWANGFKFGIKYWEIWNEPENPPMWDGTRQEFFELYRTASLRLLQFSKAAAETKLSAALQNRSSARRRR